MYASSVKTQPTGHESIIFKRRIMTAAGSRHTWIAVIPDGGARLTAGVSVTVADVWRVAHDVGAVA